MCQLRPHLTVLLSASADDHFSQYVYGSFLACVSSILMLSASADDQFSQCMYCRFLVCVTYILIFSPAISPSLTSGLQLDYTTCGFCLDLEVSCETHED